MDLRRQIAIIRAWFPLIVVSVLLVAAGAYAISGMLPKVYEAKATLIVGQSLSAANTDYNQLLVSQRLSTTYASLVTKRPILDSVIKQLDLGVTAADLSTRVRASASLDTTLLTILAQDADPTRAAAIANALTEQLIAASPAIQGRQAEFQASIDADLKATQAQIDSTQTQVETLAGLTKPTAAETAELATLEGRLVTLRATYATLLSYSSGSASNILTVVESATVPIDPISPKRLQIMLLAAVLSLLLAAAVVAVVVRLDDGIRDSDTVLEVAQLTTLGTIGRMKGDKGSRAIYRLAALLYPRSGVAEAYRSLRTNIEFASVGVSIQTLLVTSSAPGEGKTVTAANLAVVFAQAGKNVILVDADLRKPGVHLMFNLPNSYGLTTLLRSDKEDLTAIAHVTEQDNLRVITTGPLPPNPAELLGSPRMQAILKQLDTRCDLVILDSPPLQAVTDAAILSSFVDGTLFVIDAAHSRRRTVRLARESLAKADANVLGAVLNFIPERAQSDFTGYYRGYYASEEASEPPARMPETSQELPGSSTTARGHMETRQRSSQ